MTVEEMRYAISKVYPGDTWRNRVAKMSDNQVVALYYKFLEGGKFDDFGRKVRKTVLPVIETSNDSNRMTRGNVVLPDSDYSYDVIVASEQITIADLFGLEL